MFKYGSLKLFAIKFLFGSLLIIFSTFSLLSLITYSATDPGFKSTGDLSFQKDIINLFGETGSRYASLLIVLIGSASYLMHIFLLYSGLKYVLGFYHKYFVLKFFILLIGVKLLNFVLIYLIFLDYKIGILSLALIDTYVSLITYYSITNFFDYIFRLILSIFGIYLIFISFDIKIYYLKRIIIFKKILNLFNFLKFFKIFFYFLNKPRKKTNYNKVKNEPSFSKYNENKASSDLKIDKSNFKKTNKDLFKFTLPSKGLLKKSTRRSALGKEQEKINLEASKLLEKTLLDYGVEGTITGYKSGPIVTLFEFVPKAGIKASKIIGLSDDIARAMSSFSARISSQPGKQSLGIEIPNIKRESVLFGDLVENDNFKNDEANLRLALGKDISGEIIFADLEKMPHLLIAGTTGSGKSVGINAMILSLLFKFKPNECKLILIDPKMLELSVYEDIPHLLTPVVTDPSKAVIALKWVVREMENRYRLMSSINVKNITTYNNKVLKTISSGKKLFREVQTDIDADTKIPIIEKKEIPLEKMPFIVVVIDEMADLMMVAGKEVESLVQRLAQMARASGIHLITATQRPSVDVITGTIKANFPSRISYKVASKFDSRTILNEMGAEQLLGSGDMLFLENGGNIKRLHGGFVTESEVENVVNEIKNQSTFDHSKEISLSENISDQLLGGGLLSDNNTDELYSKAVEIVIAQQKVSTSYIQRYLQIGYNRAARIVEKMEEEGIISEANNAGKRNVLKNK